MTESNTVRVIKRYANRKLYDMSESCYITHEEIAALIQSGEDLQIIDNRTKTDLTSQTLTQILFEQERRHRRTLPLATLRGLFLTGGDFIQRHITQPVTQLRDEAEEKVRNVFQRREDDGEALEDEEQVAAVDTTHETGDGESDSEPRVKQNNPMRDWFEHMQRTFETTQSTLDERWNLITNSLGQFQSSDSRVTELEQRLEALEKRLAQLESTNSPQ